MAKKTTRNPETITKTKLTSTYWLGSHVELAIELEEFEGELQNALDEAGSVDFPGMF